MEDKKWEQIEPTFSLEEDRLRILREALPEAFTDGKINFDTLKELLGEAVEDEETDEHFGLSWTGKREARKLAGMPSKGTLVPVEGKGLHEDTTENIFIEGDNLEVLKLLHKSYYGKIKMIYIDPPYNTGKDFIYKDDYKMPLESYLQRSGQMDEMDELLTSNPKSSGRFHSDWLNMMYPRLRVARDLLREDGVIFVSIDDNELANLKLTMDEVFGQENFLCIFAWEKRYSPPSDTKDIGYLHESVICYKKSDQFQRSLLPLTGKQVARYKNADNDPRGVWKSMDYTCKYTADERPNLYYPIINPKGKKIYPKKTRVWAMSKEVHQKHVDEDRIWWGINGNNKVPALKNFLNEIQQGMMPTSLLKHQDVGHTDEATKDLRSIMPEVKFTPKPIRLIKHLNKIAGTNNDSIILDFFGGSGTTAHSIMELNAEDGKSRKFICVQIDELVQEKSIEYKAGFRTISEITAERIRRASNKIEKEFNEGLPLEKKPDLGFKFFRLEQSNFKAWSDYKGTDLDELRGLLESQVATSFVPDSTKDGILTEIVLLEGFPLDSEITKDEYFERNKVWRVSSEFSEHRLFITLDDEVWEETIDYADKLDSNDIFICQDKSLSDENKIRLTDVCRLKVI